MMRRLGIAAITAIFCLLVAAAFGGCGGSSKHTALAASSGDPITGSNGSYSCAKGLEALDLPLGEHVEQGGASFKLTPDGPSYEQNNVKLEVKLGANERMPAFIVVPSDYHFSASENPEVVVRSLVGRGGHAVFTLLTSAYTTGAYESIASVRLCLDLSQPQSQ